MWRALGERLRRMRPPRVEPLDIGWALALPDDPATYCVDAHPAAQALQAAIAACDADAQWAASHRCIMHLVAALPRRRPFRYLEIGVNEGQSALALATALQAQAAVPQFDELVLADDWAAHFGGRGRGSHSHVTAALAAAGVSSARTVFLDGDSKQTVPRYLAARGAAPPFDAVYVDGDHSFAGASSDLETVLPVVGGMLFFDDIYHPVHWQQDRLLALHKALVARLRDRFYVFVNRRGFGFAAFVRRELVEALT